ncbi:hypothetical protein [Streptomyces sp. NBC_01013]|uniref:hypothetical protein n=1 Tax=Streptomyces sp. NBC_01013 TaxID=2903718 RepID=UPI0038700FE2|nr:hypothetical protein OG538_04345 [Streptomyces sp. NBC_01013]
MSRKAEETNPALVTPEIEALADALRGKVGPADVERALAAFREAGNAATGTGSLGRRRRGDWRPVHRRFPTRVSLRMALGALLAVTLGGVALAAGTGLLPHPLAPAESPGPPPGVHAPRTPGSTGAGPGGATPSPAPTTPESPTPSGPATSHDPAPGNRVALCHAWTRGNGKHQGAAFRRLAEAAGGDDAVDAYCATSSGADDAAPSAPGKSAGAPAAGPSKDRPAASPSRGGSPEHTPGAGQRA